MDLISVVIPCHKQAHFLADAIESVQAQSDGRHEIVVVDDESPDHTAEVVDRYSGVTYIRQRRQERSAARNRGLRASSGPFVVFLDADDRLLPHHFRSCLDAFAVRPEVGFVCGDYRWFGEGDPTHVHDCRPRPDHYGALLRTNFIGPPHAVMFRRDALTAVGGFDPEFKSCEDQELYLRVARIRPIHCHHEVIADYRRHDQQTSRRWDVMLMYAMKMLQAQADTVRGHPDYERAWREGRVHRQRMYGEPLLWAMVAAARSREWRRSIAYLRVLLQYYPDGVRSLCREKLYRLSGMGTRLKTDSK